MSDKTNKDHLVNTIDAPKQAPNRPQQQNSSILQNASKMAFGTMTSRLLGLVRESLLAALFDKPITDAWNAAFRVPNLFRRLLGEGSLSVSFIPVFIEAEKDSQARAQNLVNSCYTLLLLILGTVTAIGVIYPEWLLNFYLDPSYIAQADKYQMTLHLAQIMFLFLFFITSFAFFMGILNSLGQFFWPAVAPTFWNIAMVISTLWPKSWLSPEVQLRGDQLAWGVVAGGFLQAAVLVPALIRSGYFPRLSLGLSNRDMRMVFRNMVPGLIGAGLLQFMTVINTKFSSGLGEGTISYINYVDRLIELPMSLISVSLGTALLPALAKLRSSDKHVDFKNTARKYLELNLFLSIVAAAGLYALAEPIVQLLFGHGKFSRADVVASSGILQTYCWIMIFVSGVRVLTPAYYAVKNTWLPMVISALALVTHLLLAPRLIELYQVHGLMMSTTISAALNLVCLLIFYHKWVGDFDHIAFFKNVLKMLVAGLIIFCVAYVLKALLISDQEIFFNLIWKLAIIMGVCALSFMVVSYAFGFEEARKVLTRLKGKLLKK